MFYIRAVSMMYKDSFSVFLGLVLGFGFILLDFMANFIFDFYMGTFRYILFLLLFFMVPTIIISLVTSIITVKLELCYKKISLSVIIVPVMLFTIALFSKIKEEPLITTGEHSGKHYAITATRLSTSFWDKYIELIQVQFICACIFTVFFIIFLKLMKKYKYSKKINHLLYLKVLLS